MDLPQARNTDPQARSPRKDVSESRLFAGVSEEAVGDLLARCTVHHLQAGQTLLTQGQDNDRLFIVLSGHLSVSLDGSDRSVADIGPDGTVGEMSVLDGEPACATVVARSDCAVLALDHGSFWRLVSASHSFCVRMLLRLSERLRVSNSNVLKHLEISRQFERAALHDALTGAHSRRWIEETLPRLVQRHARDGTCMSLALLDIDHFKRINDTFGHQTGDVVLGAVGGLFSDRVRPTDVVARYGGEEFLLVFPNTPLMGARACVERVRQAVSALEITDPSTGEVLPTITVSAGIAQLESSDDLVAVLSQADRALYRAKSMGRNRTEPAPIQTSHPVAASLARPPATTRASTRTGEE